MIFLEPCWFIYWLKKLRYFEYSCLFLLWLNENFLKRLKFFKSDNGTEFNCLLDYFNATEILFQTSCIWAPCNKMGGLRGNINIFLGRALEISSQIVYLFLGRVCTCSCSFNKSNSLSSFEQQNTIRDFLWQTSVIWCYSHLWVFVFFSQ